MARAVKKKAAPFDEKKFFTWLRSGLRSMSRRYPPIYEALAAAKVPYNGPDKKRKVSYRCAECGGFFSGKEVAVDHRIDCGSLTCWDDVKGFMQRLFCKQEGLDVLCHTCHDIKTYMSKYGVSKEEAILQKNVIAIMKYPKQKLLDYLHSYGYNGIAVSNASKRKQLVEVILRGEANVCTS